MASNNNVEFEAQLLAPPLSELPLQDQESPSLPTVSTWPRLPPPRFGNHITMLSIDGGGIRGLIPAVVLQRLEEHLQKIEKNKDARLADYFDVVTGTSTGALIAAMLVTPNQNGRPKYTPHEIKDFYMKNGPKIFPPKRSCGPIGMIRAWWGPKYDGTFLHEEIRTVTGDVTLADTLSNLVVPAFDVNKLQPVIFSSYKNPQWGAEKPLLSDVCIGTAAAPTFFPAHHFDIAASDNTEMVECHLIDGGVAANNPTMAAIAAVTREQLLKNADFHPDGVDYKKYVVISIGTGSAVKEQGLYTAEGCAKWGAINWLYNGSNRHSPIIDIYSHATAALVDCHVRMLLHDTTDTIYAQNYLRIQAQAPLFGEDMLPMDDATLENMNNLVDVGKKLLEEKLARVALTTGKYETIDIPHLICNDDELERFAGLLFVERCVRLQSQGKEKNSPTDKTQDVTSTTSMEFSHGRKPHVKNFGGGNFSINMFMSAGGTPPSPDP